MEVLKEPYMMLILAALAYGLALICISKKEQYRFSRQDAKLPCMNDSTARCRCNKVIYNNGGYKPEDSANWSKYVVSCMSNYPSTEVSDAQLWEITKNNA
jgi:hypothetical protein